MDKQTSVFIKLNVLSNEKECSADIQNNMGLRKKLLTDKSQSMWNFFDRIPFVF